MKKEINIIKGNHHTDERGSVAYFNELLIDEVKRFYVLTHNDVKIFRAWQGHLKESKWFHVIHGTFKILVVEPDNWETPSLELIPREIILRAGDDTVLHLTGGYATGIQSLEENSKMLIFSDFNLEDSKSDDFRFDKNLWNN